MGRPLIDALEPSVLGKAPVNGAGVGTGPYAFAAANRDPTSTVRGFSSGFGLLNGNLDAGGTTQATALSGGVNLGGWRGADGKTNAGASAEASLVKAGMPSGGALGPFGWDIGVLTANATGAFNDSTAQLGAQANILESSATLGNKEHSLRLGGSVGMGMAGRAHYGDEDHDRVRELGFGFDVGPFSMDVKSEALGRAWNGLKAASSWVGTKASSAWDVLSHL